MTRSDSAPPGARCSVCRHRRNSSTSWPSVVGAAGCCCSIAAGAPRRARSTETTGPPATKVESSARSASVSTRRACKRMLEARGRRARARARARTSTTPTLEMTRAADS
eukprot:16428-Prymnesium_polylepis.1